MTYSLGDNATLVPLSAVWDDAQQRWELGNGDSHSAAVSGDSLVVAWVSKATNLVPEDRDPDADIVVRSLGSHQTQLLVPAAADGEHGHPMFLFGSRTHLLFSSTSTSLDPSVVDVDDKSDLFLATLSYDDVGRIVDRGFTQLTLGLGAVPLDSGLASSDPLGGSMVLLTVALPAEDAPWTHKLLRLDESGQIELLAATQAPITAAKVLPGGMVAFTTTSASVDLEGDGVGDVPGSDTNGKEDLFLWRVVDEAQGLREVTRLSADASGSALAGSMGTRILDASRSSLSEGSLIVTSDVVGGQTGSSPQYPGPQLMELRFTSGSSIPQSWNPIQAARDGDIGRHGHAYVGTDGVVRLDRAGGDALLSAGDAAGTQAVDGQHGRVQLLPIMLDARQLGVAPTEIVGSAPAVLFETREASRLHFDVTTQDIQSTASQVVLAGHGLGIVGGPVVSIDYSGGSALNPLNAIGASAEILIDVPDDRVTEYEPGGTFQIRYDGSLSARLGRDPIGVSEDVFVSLPWVTHGVETGFGDDLFAGGRFTGYGQTTVLPDGSEFHLPVVWMSALISAGSGHDRLVLQGDRHSELWLWGGVDELIFAPGATPGAVTVGSFNVNVGEFSADLRQPLGRITGSVGADVLEFVPRYSQLPGSRAVDLGGFSWNGFGGSDRRDFVRLDNWVGSVQAATDVAVEVRSGVAADGTQGVAVVGKEGDDRLVAGPGPDRFDGGAGRNGVDYRLSPLPVQIDLGSSSFSGGYAQGDSISKVVVVHASDAADGDAVSGSMQSETLYGWSGDDVLSGNGGDDVLDGGSGDDDLSGGEGDDQLYGSAGDDRIDGGADDDVAVLPGRREDYEVDPEGAAVGRFAGADLVLRDLYAGFERLNEGTDAFFGVERFRFDDGAFTSDELRTPLVSIDTSAGASFVSEGSGSGGVLEVRLVRTQDLSLPVSGTWRLVADPQATHGLGNDDLIGLRLGTEEPFDFGGERFITVRIPLAGDHHWEHDESVRFEIARVNGGLARIPSSATLGVVDDDAFAFTLKSPWAVLEGDAWFLTVEPAAGLELDDVDRYLVDWGDGPAQEYGADDMARAQGRLSHVYADGAAGSTTRSVSVTAIGPSGLKSEQQTTVRVADVPPRLDVSGPGSVDHGRTYTLQLGAYADQGDDPLQRLTIDWRDGTPPTELTGTLPAQVEHVFAGMGTHEVVVFAHNDDGRFAVDWQDVRVMPPPGITVFQFFRAYEPVPFQDLVHPTTFYEGASPVGRLQVERLGDLSGVASVSVTIVGSSERTPSIDRASDVVPISVFAPFLPGQSVAQVTPGGFFRDDGVAEGVEYARAVLIDPGRPDVEFGPSSTVGIAVRDRPLPQFYLLAPRSSVFEGQTIAVNLIATGPYNEALALRIFWGDGNPEEVNVPAGHFANGGSLLLSHRFADAPAGGLDASVTFVFPTGLPWITEWIRVDDVAPRMSVSGPGWVEPGHLYTLNLGEYTDVAGDPLQRIVVDWGDGSALTVVEGAPPATLSHAYPPFLADHDIRVWVHNDDGVFLVGTQDVSVVARLGGVAAATPAQFQAAWTDPVVASIGHKADLADAVPATPVSLNTANSGVLAGGDIFALGGRGLLGVSGRTQIASTVRQEIDGTEALIFDLADGQRASGVVVDLAMFVRNDHGGNLSEGLRVLLYDGDRLVGQSLHQATTTSGRERVVVDSPIEFDRVAFQAGVNDATGAFVPGAGRHPSTGALVMPSAHAASEFLLDGLFFLNTDDPIALIGLPPYGP